MAKMVYNIADKEWFIATPEDDIHSFCRVPAGCRRVGFSELGAAQSREQPWRSIAISELGTFSPTGKKRVWGGRYGRVYEQALTVTNACSLSGTDSRDGRFRVRGQ